MTDANGNEQLVISRRRIILENTAAFIFLFVAFVPVTVALGVGFLASATDGGDIVAGIVFLVAGVVVAVVLVRFAVRRTQRALASVPLIELTPTHFHMRDAAGVDHWVKRPPTVWVAWRYAANARPLVSELDFFDRSTKRVGSWVISPNVGRPVLRWLRAHGVPARLIRNRAALERVPFAADHDRR